MLLTAVLCFSRLHALLVTSEKRGLLTFESNSITADGSDGIIDIILSLYSRVDMDHLKVHWHTAEPTLQTT